MRFAQYSIRLSVILALVFLLRTSAHAGYVVGEEMLDGSTITGTFSDGLPAPTEYFYSPGTLYESHRCFTPPFFHYDCYDVLFHPPLGTTILKGAIKDSSYGDVMVLLLSDNTVVVGVYEFLPGDTGTTWHWKPIGKIQPQGPSQSFEALIAEDLYILSTAYVYVSHDTGKT